MRISLFSRIISPTALLYEFIIVAETTRGVYITSGIDPPPAFILINALCFLWLMGWWLRRDKGKRSLSCTFDIGMFLYVAWPIIMPYHLLKSRGTKGLLIILGFIGAYVGAGVLGVVLYMLFAP
ncbi:MAG: hypothetical protein JWM21_525 [Acidobacteria bacterium]|nr:hypothetical protein [Acidobacteriota bacterium]